ncbi:hypothetical protein LTS17_006771 [Exophiala oligosperma]
MTAEEVPIPGTVHLIDLEGTMQATHGSGENKDLILIPTPTDDPDDPLTWSPRRKLLALSCMIAYMMAVGVSTAAMYSVFGDIQANSTLTLNNLNQGTGYMFGKRPTYLISVLGTMGTMIWAPYTTNNAQWIASKILQGFFGSPIESLCEITITDLYYTHQRGFYTAVYALSLSGSNLSAPIISGFIATGQGWRWVLYWCAILCAIVFVFLFFFMEETNFVRLHVQASVAAVTVEEEEKRLESTSVETPAEETKESAVTGTNNIGSINTSELDEGVVSQDQQQRRRQQKPKTYLTKLQLWQKEDLRKENQFWGMVKRPLIYLRFPVIVFCGFYYGSSLVWFNVLNATSALILSGTYGFSTSMVGVSYIAPLLGVFVGAAYTGIWGNRVTLAMARRRGGILESEYRLWLLTPAIVLLPFGLILWGVGSSRGIHWFGAVFAAFVVSGASAISVQGMCNYCIESYRALSGEAIVTVILIRNTMSFAIGYGVTPWVQNLGHQNAFIVAAAAAMVQCATVLVMIWKGKSLRKKSAARYAQYVEKMAAVGMAH